jgi:hypothetical protein
MARLAARKRPTQQEMQVSLARWQDVLLHISSAWGEPGAPTWHGPVVMARYRLDALAAAQEIAALLERMNDKRSGHIRVRLPASDIRLGLPHLN